jgi:hypothetical protein
MRPVQLERRRAMSELQLERTGDAVTVTAGDVVVAEYSAMSTVPATDAPKPYFHPLRTPLGLVVTGFAPEDHTWHHGLSFAFPRVADHNLWGGGTFLDLERGYIALDDHGVIQHDRWLPSEPSGFAHEISWLGRNGEKLIHEDRCWNLRSERDAIVIDFDTVLRNLTDEPLSLETPGQRGRPDGGYGGLWLRLAEGFTAENLVGDAGEIRESGAESDTLIVHGRAASGEAVTLGLSFGDSPGNRNWVFRFESFSAIGWGIAYLDGLVIPVGGDLTIGHRLVILDGHVDAATVRELL